MTAMIDTPSGNLLTPKEAAGVLRVSRETVYRLIRSGLIPACRLGGPHAPLRVDRDELDDWLRQDPGETA